MCVRVDDAAQENGLALILGDLIRQNLEQHPERKADLRAVRANVGITAQDADSKVAVTLCFDGRELEIREGLHEPLALHVRSDYEGVLALTQIPLTCARLPCFASAPGRAAVAALLRRRLRIAGLVRHAGVVVRLLRLIAVSGG